MSSLFICPTCLYSTHIKCNFTKHIDRNSCKKKANEIQIETKYCEKYETQLAEIKATYEAEIKTIVEKYEAIIETLKVKKEKREKKKTKEDYRKMMMRILDKKGIKYEPYWSLEKLRKRNKEVMIIS